MAEPCADSPQVTILKTAGGAYICCATPICGREDGSGMTRGLEPLLFGWSGAAGQDDDERTHTAFLVCMYMKRALLIRRTKRIKLEDRHTTTRDTRHWVVLFFWAGRSRPELFVLPRASHTFTKAAWPWDPHPLGPGNRSKKSFRSTLPSHLQYTRVHLVAFGLSVGLLFFLCLPVCLPACLCCLLVSAPHLRTKGGASG